MFQAIQTTYKGPTNARGSRIIAVCDAGRITVSYDHALNADGNHRAAALALCAKLQWDSAGLVGGALKDGSRAFVFATER